MEMQYFMEFVKVAELKNFSQAADVLFMSQSTLSKHIQKLEKHLGFVLFDRSTRQVVLNENGMKVLPIAIEICKYKVQLERISLEQQSIGRQQLKIASIPVMAQYKITQIISQFKKKYPHVIINVLEQEGCDIEATLLDEACDLAFYRPTVPLPKALSALPFALDHLIAVLPCLHALGKEKTISLSQLKDEDFLLLDERTTIYQLSQEACLASGFTPKVIYTSNRPENLLEMVKRQMGVALLLKQHTIFFNQEDIRCVALDAMVDSTLCLVRLKKHHLNEAAHLFWGFIQ